MTGTFQAAVVSAEGYTEALQPMQSLCGLLHVEGLRQVGKTLKQQKHSITQDGHMSDNYAMYKKWM